MLQVPLTRSQASDERYQDRGYRGNRTPDQYDDHANGPGPVGSVLPGLGSTTTKTGRPRQRMQWTDELNETLMHCYYEATDRETITHGYRHDFHHRFITHYPHLTHLTEQRLMDQKRSIIVNNRIPQSTLDRLKRDTDIRTTPTAQDPNDNHNIPSTSVRDTPIVDQAELNDTDPSILEAFTQTYDTYRQISINNRPSLPRLFENKTTTQLLETIDNIVHSKITIDTDMTELNTLIYSAAYTSLKLNGQDITDQTNHLHTRQNKPHWQTRLETKIQTLRKEIGQLTQAIKGNTSTKIQRRTLLIVNRELRRENNGQETDHATQHDVIIDILDRLKQRLSAQAKRLKRYLKNYRRKRDNRQFLHNEKRFYQNLNSPDTNTNHNAQSLEPPPTDQIESFWTNLWSRPQTHNTNTHWIHSEKQRMTETIEMTDTAITLQDVRNAINRTHNWKAPGIDKIQNYWIKKLTKTHDTIAKIFQGYLDGTDIPPQFLTTGLTYLKPKDEDTTNPSKYRPITCLPTIYKLLTAIVTDKIYKHVDEQNILSDEQKGCRRRTQGCKEQVITDAEIVHQARLKRRNLHYAYIDYKKAYDSVPHSWLLDVLDIYKIDIRIRTLLKRLMHNWTTTLTLTTPTDTISIPNIHIRRGIFQGDSLSPLWFCLAINPLSFLLNNSRHGYKLTSRTDSYKINHLLYMDDLKLYAATDRQLKYLLTETENFSTDIQMEMGINKCKIGSMIKGQLQQQIQYTLRTTGETITTMNDTDYYKYLGFTQQTEIDHGRMKQTLTTEYGQRLRQLLRTGLNGRNMTKAINTYAIPVLTYSFGIVKWNHTELDALNRLTRTTCNKYKIHHIHSNTDRLTLPRTEGGRGLIDITNLHYEQITKLRSYFYQQSHSNRLHRILTNLDTSGTPLHLNDRQYNVHSKVRTDEDKLENWKSKTLHGKHAGHLTDERNDKTASNAWLTRGGIYAETEGFMIAIQDQTIRTRNYAKHILKDNTITTDKCRKCNRQTETIDHITSGCTLLAGTDYTRRHNNVAKQIHQDLAINHKLIDRRTETYNYTPSNVLENGSARLYWDRDITTDVTIQHNRPDIVLMNKLHKTTYLIDISIPNSSNIHTKHTDKIDKYSPLAQELKDQWKQTKIVIVPIVISSTGIIPNTLHKSLKTLSLPQHIYKDLQKTVIIETCSITRRFLGFTEQNCS